MGANKNMHIHIHSTYIYILSAMKYTHGMPIEISDTYDMNRLSTSDMYYMNWHVYTRTNNIYTLILPIYIYVYE